MSFFADIPLLPEDPILNLPVAFKEDPRPEKINLGIGAYKSAEGHPFVLAAVQKAESILLQKHLDKEYLPIDGDPDFLRHSLRLLFGIDSPFLKSGLYYAAQTPGGTSALRIGAEFLSKISRTTIFLPQPSWSNHKQVFERAGLNIGSYPYYNDETSNLDFGGMCRAIKNMPPKSAILLHGCCQNPTGLDPTFEEWQELSNLIERQNVIPFFDIAYQGFGTDLDEDARAVRLFADRGHEMLTAYSYSKNFGLYGERTGFLTLCLSEKGQANKIASQIRYLIRANYSNPPLHGARIVSTILKSPELTSEWKTELSTMRERVREMRKSLIATLLSLSREKDFSSLYKQIGLFCFLGLNRNEVRRLREEFAIYMPDDGRINAAGLSTRNVLEIAKAILTVI